MPDTRNQLSCTQACSDMPGHNRAQEKERGGDTALGHAETPETMLSRDDGNGGKAEGRLTG
ncbi:hypothetical protein ASY01nite_24430 [Acetobacter syzygii]|nr:hypothetical protein Absy_026_008 [Acetobacter syzygii]GBR65306.1 hypothetical protein AA0483_1791 [Acetobacter syzygii NRIC 0483]GEL57377.1 hypothetical protein ASY01nite_24430 [Acetobacter syzygii]